MKILSITIKILMVFLLAGALLFSCKLADADNGTLVISTENNSARKLIPLDKKKDIKSYRVICSNEGNEIIKNFKDSTTLSLSPGTWTVTVSALAAKEEEVGAGKKDVSIIAGKTTAFPMTLWPPEFKEFSLEGLDMPEGGELLYVFQDSDPQGKTKQYNEDLADLKGKMGGVVTTGIEITWVDYTDFFILVFDGVTQNEYNNYVAQLNLPPYKKTEVADRYKYITKNNIERVLTVSYVKGKDEKGNDKYYMIILVRDGPVGWWGKNKP